MAKKNIADKYWIYGEDLHNLPMRCPAQFLYYI